MEPQHGLSAGKLSDSELERQGTRAHATRNWVFLHGTADQFRHHTERIVGVLPHVSVGVRPDVSVPAWGS